VFDWLAKKRDSPKGIEICIPGTCLFWVSHPPKEGPEYFDILSIEIFPE